MTVRDCVVTLSLSPEGGGLSCLCAYRCDPQCKFCVACVRVVGVLMWCACACLVPVCLDQSSRERARCGRVPPATFAMAKLVK